MEGTVVVCMMCVGEGRNRARSMREVWWMTGVLVVNRSVAEKKGGEELRTRKHVG